VPLIVPSFSGRRSSIPRAAPESIGYDYSSMIFYFMLTVFLENLITPTEDEWQIAGEIREWPISAFLTKPLTTSATARPLPELPPALHRRVLVPIIVSRGSFAITCGCGARGTWLAFGASTAMAAFLQFFIAYALAMIAFGCWRFRPSSSSSTRSSSSSAGMSFRSMSCRLAAGFIHWSPFTYELFFPGKSSWSAFKVPPWCKDSRSRRAGCS